jgi:nickel-type superoxide dismutase maturation protease
MRWPIWRVKVAGRSMQPTFDPGDMILVRRTIWPGRVPRVRAGQVVVARNPGQPDQLLVKRALWPEDGGWWLSSDHPGAGQSSGNPRGGAADSFRFGPVPVSLIEGRVLLRYHRGRPGDS